MLVTTQPSRIDAALTAESEAALRLAIAVELAESEGFVRLWGISTPAVIRENLTALLNEYREAAWERIHATAAAVRPVYNLDDPALTDPAAASEPDCCT